MGIPTLLLGLAAVAVLIFIGRIASTADPKKLAKLVRTIGGIASFALAALLTARGQFFLAIPVAVFGAGLLGWVKAPASWTRRTQRSTGQVSRVRSQFVEMELDHDSGEMRGTILAGKFENVPLDALDPPTLLKLRGEFDPESRALLEAYLDRRTPGWREDVDEDTGPRRGEPPRQSAMTEEEAYQILGLETGATDAEVRRAHRSLMKKLHPDQGGSTYLAARVNEAKEVLLRRHH